MSQKLVTVDGPAASGKSSVSREIARKMGWNWLSSGAFYRAVAYSAMQNKTDLKSEAAVLKLIEHPRDWSIHMGAEKTHVLFNGEDVSDQAFHESVGNVASQISHFPKFREQLLPLQRECFEPEKGLIVEGRDCGTVVFPEASIKLFLTARSEDRAARRAKEQGGDVEALVKEQQVRDERDKKRAAAPLAIPEGAEVIDTSKLTLEEVINRVEKLVTEQL